MTLYDYPELYAALFAPDPEMWDGVRGWLGRYLDEPPRSILDPACGPGNWLLPFAERGWRVGGNDRNPAMCAYAQHILSPFDAEITQGDMRELAFRSDPFDAAINLDASVGHLPDDNGVVRHLRSIHTHLRPGGIYLLGITVLDLPRRQEWPEALFESDPVAVGQGTVTVKYTSLWRDPALRRERIALEMHSRGVPNGPPLLREQYDLLTFAPADLHRILAQAGGWHLLAIHDMTLDGFPDHGFQPGCRGVTVVLRAEGVSG